MRSSSNSVSQWHGKHLTLVIEHEYYGVAATSVREIIRDQKVTRVPQLPAHIRGAITVRGRAIAVVDLRVMLGLKAEIKGLNCIVVVHVTRSPKAEREIGLIVDAVEDVHEITPAQIEPMPETGTSSKAPYIVGMAKVGDKVITLLDIDCLLTPDTWNAT